MRLDEQVSANAHPVAGRDSSFIGQLHSGEIYNQYPQECWLEGTRGAGCRERDVKRSERQFSQLLTELGRDTRTSVAVEFRFIRDAFLLNQDDSLVTAFQEAYTTTTGHPLPVCPSRLWMTATASGLRQVRPLPTAPGGSIPSMNGFNRRFASHGCTL